MSHSQKNVVKINLSYTIAIDADIIGRSSFSKQDEFMVFLYFNIILILKALYIPLGLPLLSIVHQMLHPKRDKPLE